MAKTLNDFLDEHINVFPSDVDDATQALIIKWFGYRQVAHSVFFPNWMERTLDRDYPRYQELLRIEARTAGSEYDWLVTNYIERQVEIKNTDATTKTGSTVTAQTNERTYQAGISEQVVDNGSDRDTGTTTLARTGTDNNLMTRNLASTLSGSEEVEESTSSEGTRTPNLTSENKNSNNNTSRHGFISRQAPYDMDLSGNSASLNANVNHVVGADGVDTSLGEVANDSHFMAGFPNLAIQNPTSTSDELTDNSDVTFGQTTQSGTETTENEGSRTGETSRSETSSDSGTESNARTLNLQDQQTDNLTKTHNLTSTRTKSGEDVDTTEISGTVTNTGSDRSSHDGLEREIHTGRSGQSPQFLLDEAVKFIKETSAWQWLYRQIDKCFMMCYDISEYEEV